MDNDVIKHSLLQALPISRRSSLSAHLDLPPEKFAQLVDTKYSYLKDTFRQNPNVYETRHSSSSSMHASLTQSKETAQSATVSSYSHPDNDPKFAAFTCFSLTPPNDVSPGESGLDQSPHTSNRHLAHNHPPHRKKE